MSARLRGRDVVSIADLSAEELWEILDLAGDLKRRLRAGDRPPVLAGRALAMVFEKASLRTRVTFEVGMQQLGGSALYLGPQDIQMGARESVGDVGRNLSRWVDGIMARTFAHRTVVELADGATVPVINGLSDLEHPCQTLADLLTMWERFRRLEGLAVAWVGDGNNVAHSLMLAAAALGIDLRVATPEGYVPDEAVTARARAIASRAGGALALTHDPRRAVAGASVIYTDVWASMGQEAEREVRARVFRPFQVDASLVEAAGADAVVMHCLPAHRGEEITAEVLDGPRSIVLDQAENRLHAQKALLALLL